MKQIGKVALKMRLGLVACGMALAGCDSHLIATGKEAPFSMAVTVPDPRWKLMIEQVLERPNDVWVLAHLTRAEGMGAQMITSAEAALPISLPDKPRKFFLTGKTWGWKNEEPYVFVPDLLPVVKEAGNAKVLFKAPNSGSAAPVRP